MNFYNAMTNRQNVSSAQYSSPVDGLLMDRLSVIARNRGMGGRRLGPHRMCRNNKATFMPNEFMNIETFATASKFMMLVPYYKKHVHVTA